MWLYAPPTKTSAASPSVSTPARYGWTITGRPAASSRPAWAGRSSSFAPYRAVSWAPALTVGLTTTSDQDGQSPVPFGGGVSQAVGTTGTPAAASSRR